MDWESIWRRTTALPGTFFLFNHRLLLTGSRSQRIGLSSSDTCPSCKQAPETDEHVMIDCPSRQALVSWLTATMSKNGCKTLPKEFIRGHIGRTPKSRDLFTLTAAYVHLMWEERKKHRIPSEEKMEAAWKRASRRFNYII